MEKLFLITRTDLPPGLRAAQLNHAFREFVQQHPKVERAWYEQSNTLALLEVPNEKALTKLLEDARWKGIPVAFFLEPDLGNELTAIALSPTGKRLCQRLPLAFSQEAQKPAP